METLLAGLRAAAEPTRLRIIALCALGELTVSELTKILGQSQPRVSRHLKLLCEAGLLDRFREGSWAYHRLAPDGIGAVLAETLVAMIPDGDATRALDLDRLEEIRQARAAAAAAYFRRNAHDWDEIRSLYADEREVERTVLTLLPTDGVDDLLDIGTGTGRMLELFAPRVDHAVGIDLSLDMLAVARNKLSRAELTNCMVRQADMYHLPMAHASFDAVIIHQVLHFAEGPAAAITEAARVLRPGGRLLIVDFARHDLEYLRAEHAHRRLGFADDEVQGWCAAAGLKMTRKARLKGDPLTVSFWSAQRPTRVRRAIKRSEMRPEATRASEFAGTAEGGHR